MASKRSLIDDSDSSDDELNKQLLSLAKKKKVDSPPAQEEKQRKPSVSEPSSSDDESNTSSDDEDDEWRADGKSTKKKKKLKGKSTPQPAVKKKEEEEESSPLAQSSDEEGEISDDSSDGNGSGSKSDDSDGSDEDLPAFDDGLDENLIGDEEDRKTLEQMSEKDREQELFNRMERREAMKTRLEIEHKLRAERKREKKASKSTTKKHKSHGSTKDGSQENFTGSIGSRKRERKKNVDEKKMNAIDELRQKRKEKKEKMEALMEKKTPLTTKDVFSDDDEEEDTAESAKESGSSDSDEDRDAGSDEEEKEEESVPISECHELEQLRLSRNKLERWVHLPFFSKLIIGCFLRMGIGNHDGRPVYRVVEIIDTSEAQKVYTLGSTRTNKCVKVRHGLQERTFRMEYVSNQRFTDSEFRKWKEEINLVELPLPTTSFVKKKAEEVIGAKTYNFKEDDITMIVKEKEKHRKNPLNYAVRKNKLLRNKDIAEQGGDFDEARKVDEQLEELEEKAEKLDKERSGALSNVSFINERNRKKNVYDAEKAAVEEGRRGNYLEDMDIFMRRKTNSLLGQEASQIPAEMFASPQPKGLDKLAVETPQPEVKEKPENEPESPLSKEKVIESLISTPILPAVITDEKDDVNGEHESDLHDLHNFDIQIDVMISDSRSISLTPKPSMLQKDGPPRRSLNLDEYKKRKGLI